MLVFGHRRSGNHLLIEYLNQIFNESGIKRHEFNENEIYEKKLDKIYIVRDGRDVLVSCYNWWKNSGESHVCGIDKDFKNVSFSQYLRGVDVPSYRPHPPGNVSAFEVAQGMFSDPIGYWNNHVIQGVFEYDMPFVTFESLVNDPVSVLNWMSQKFNLKFVNPPHKIHKLVGHHPRKGITGEWKNYFSDEDLRLFRSKTAKAEFV